jgi:hypothetical protein
MGRRDDDHRRRWSRREDRRRRGGANGQRIWERSARQIGLRDVDFDRSGDVEAQGRVHRLQTVIRGHRPRPNTYAWTVTVRIPALAGRLSLAPESRLSRLGGVLGNPDIHTGDAEFDARVRVRGIAPYARAALTAPVRRSVLDGLARGIDMSGDRLEWVFDDSPLSRRPVACAARLAQLGSRLLLSRDELAVGLLQNAVWDPLPGVRVRSMEFLVEHAGGPRRHAVLQAGAKGARSDDGSVRRAAAPLLLAAWVADPTVINVLGEAQLICMVEGLGARTPPGILRRLGDCGSDQALPALLDLSSGLLLPFAVKEAARGAAAQLRARAGDAGGALSLAPQGEGGGVSLIPKPGGTLEFAD